VTVVITKSAYLQLHAAPEMDASDTPRAESPSSDEVAGGLEMDVLEDVERQR